jgi:hypothetical protein
MLTNIDYIISTNRNDFDLFDIFYKLNLSIGHEKITKFDIQRICELNPLANRF